MQVEAAARKLPDVFYMSVSYVKDWVAMGALENLQRYVDRDIDPTNYFSGVFKMVRYPDAKGDMYAFPFAWVVCISYYNKDMFNKAGLPYPKEGWTYDDLLNYAKKLTVDKNGDGQTDQWGYYVYGRYAQFDPFIYGNGGDLTSSDFKRFTLGDDPRAKRAAQFLVDLVAKHKVSPTTAMMKGIKEPFGEGLLAMITEGSWRIDTFRKSAGDNFDWAIVLPPVGPDVGKHITWGWPDSMSISKFSNHKEEAWDFVKFMTGPGRPVDSYMGGKVSIYRPIAENEAWLERGQRPANKEVVLQAGKLLAEVSFAPHWEEWRNIMQSELERALRGEATLDQVIADIKPRIEEILARED
ncbi:MAG: ABC transporter substrate-binding protein [bacterium]